MPQLDVSFMLSDPMLADCFTVTRRADVVGANGRTTPTIVDVFEGITGVVTQQDPADLMREPDGQMVPHSIMVCTCFALRGVVVGAQPDIITFNGTDFLVKTVFAYSRFGNGTYEAVATSMTATDVVQ
jgi:hypothetical protein